MDIRTYIRGLVEQRREGNYTPELIERLNYAKAYRRGEEALTLYRDRAIAAEIGRTYNQDAQLAILFNKDTHPDEYGMYQMFRAECKAKVDAEMAHLKAELEAILAKEEAEVEARLNGN